MSVYSWPSQSPRRRALQTLKVLWLPLGVGEQLLPPFLWDLSHARAQAQECSDSQPSAMLSSREPFGQQGRRLGEGAQAARGQLRPSAMCGADWGRMPALHGRGRGCGVEGGQAGPQTQVACVPRDDHYMPQGLMKVAGECEWN